MLVTLTHPVANFTGVVTMQDGAVVLPFTNGTASIDIDPSAFGQIRGANITISIGAQAPAPPYDANLDVSTAAIVTAAASSTTAALRAAYVPKWNASTAYTAGDAVLDPSGRLVTANATFTSAGSYSASNWTPVNPRRSWLDVQDYGVVGDGSTDDTAALNTALAASASTGLELRCRPDHTYLVSRAGTKSFKNPAGSTITGKGYCIQIPTGARVDFRGAKLLHVAGGVDNVVLCNSTTTGTGDVITVRNVTVDGGGRTDAVRSLPMVWFYGCDLSTFENVQLRNCSYVAGQLAAITRSTFDKLIAYAITGQGWILGGNTFDQIFDCEFGTLDAWDIASGGTFSQQGNSFCVGGQRLKIQRIIGRNCAGGHKYMPGCLDVHTDYAEFDGQALYGESANGTVNSGTKVQGDVPTATGTGTANGTTGLTAVTGSGWTVGQYIYGPQIQPGTTITAVGAGTLTLSTTVPTGTSLSLTQADAPPPDRISFSKIVSRNCTGQGLYLYYFVGLRIDNYLGYKNGRAGTNADVMCSNFDTLEIDTLRSDWAGFTAVALGSGSNRAVLNTVIIRNFADVVGTNANALEPGGVECRIGTFECIDNRSTPVTGTQVLNATTSDLLWIENYRAQGPSAILRLWNARSFVGNAIFSVTDGLSNTFTPAASATSTVVSNANSRSFTYNGGFVEPIIQIIPMNAAAVALGVPRYTIPSQFQFKAWHPAAAGTEVFLYRIVGYAWRATQFA